MVELDTTSLLPLDYARELHLQGRRELVEKNWGFFESELRYAVYLPEPHQILRCNFEGTSELDCYKTDTTTWDNTLFSRQWGVLRGGAPPQLVDGEYYSVGHSVRNGTLGRITVAAVYSFSANSPFHPTRRPLYPLPLPNPFGSRTELPPLNPETEETVYPSGAIYHNSSWAISYGLNDEHCAITVVPHQDLLKSMESIVPVPSTITTTRH